MKKYLFGLMIVLAAGLILFLLFNQGLFTAADGAIEPADDAVNVSDDTLEPVEEVVVDAPDEEAADEVNESDVGEGQNVADDAGFTITNFPYQDFIQARGKGEPIVIKFYSET